MKDKETLREQFAKKKEFLNWGEMCYELDPSEWADLIDELLEMHEQKLIDKGEKQDFSVTIRWIEKGIKECNSILMNWEGDDEMIEIKKRQIAELRKAISVLQPSQKEQSETDFEKLQRLDGDNLPEITKEDFKKNLKTDNTRELLGGKFLFTEYVGNTELRNEDDTVNIQCDNLTRKEAVVELLMNHKIVHKYFTEGEYLVLHPGNNRVLTEDGCDITEYFHKRTMYEDGWAVLEEEKGNR